MILEKVEIATVDDLVKIKNVETIFDVVGSGWIFERINSELTLLHYIVRLSNLPWETDTRSIAFYRYQSIQNMHNFYHNHHLKGLKWI